MLNIMIIHKRRLMLPTTVTVARLSPTNQQPRPRNRQQMMLAAKRNKLKMKPMEEKISFSTFEQYNW